MKGLFFVCLFFSCSLFGQPADEWNGYVSKVFESSQDKYYLSFAEHNISRTNKAFFYFLNGNEHFVAVNHGDTLFQQIRFPDPGFFRFVSENKKHFKRVMDHRNKQSGELLKKLQDTSAFVTTMGIKVSGFHYNHFVEVTDKYISTLRSEKLQESYRVVNQFISKFRNELQKLVFKK